LNPRWHSAWLVRLNLFFCSCYRCPELGKHHADFLSNILKVQMDPASHCRNQPQNAASAAAWRAE
jgi:hypothetical protein